MNLNLLRLFFLSYLSMNTINCSPLRLEDPGIYSDDPVMTESKPRKANWMDLEESENDDVGVKVVDCRRGMCGTSEAAPPKREMFVSRGWGAGGMPFNVLYMNSKSPKMSPSSTQPRPSTILAEPLRSSSTDINTEYPIEPTYNAETEHLPRSSSRYMGRAKNKNSNSSSMISSRKHYSIIPQLFVSYGWGPIGK